MDWQELTPIERLVAEQAVLNLRSLNMTCRMAADGQVLRLAEAQAMEQGRDLTRKMLEVSLEQEGREVEKKVTPPGRAAAD